MNSSMVNCSGRVEEEPSDDPPVGAGGAAEPEVGVAAGPVGVAAGSTTAPEVAGEEAAAEEEAEVEGTGALGVGSVLPESEPPPILKSMQDS